MMRPFSPATLIVSLMFVLVLHPVTSSAQIIDRVLASVGGRIVTASDVRMAREFGLVQVRGMTATDPQMILERLVNRMLVLDEVGRYAPPEPAEREVKERFDVLRARFETSEAFAAAMRITGVDEATLMQWVRNDLRIRAYLDQRFAGVVEPSGADLENYVRQIRTNAAKSGRTMEDGEVTSLAREQAVADRRQALIQEWIEGLRRRAAISFTQAEF